MIRESKEPKVVLKQKNNRKYYISSTNKDKKWLAEPVEKVIKVNLVEFDQINC